VATKPKSDVVKTRDKLEITPKTSLSLDIVEMAIIQRGWNNIKEV
jgi:hypothetical protein